MINTESLDKAKSLIKTEKSPIIIKSQNDLFNRKILEYGKFDIILSTESGKRRDNLKQLDSGINEVMARIAVKNNICIGFDMNEINHLEKKEKAQRIARIRQIIKTVRKTKTKIRLINYKDKKNASNFLLSLGASSQQAKEAISF